jgi:glycolate oxidase FAD binding subunit
MIDREHVAALLELLGEEGVEEHAPVDVDGAEVGVTLRPEDGPSLAKALAALASRGLSALVRGGGNRLGFGNPPIRADVILSTERLCGVDVFEPAEGVCHVRAGTTLRELRAVVNPEGWDVPLDPPGERATAGGVIAAAAIGPRAHAFGPPRGAVLGLEVALAGGERTRCGGRVVKNVTGYDLGKLYTGSFGTLAVIEAAWLRLRPLPQRVRCLEAPLSELADACAGALAAARLESARATALLVPAGGPEPGGGPEGAPSGEADPRRRSLRIEVELAGDAAGVDRAAEWLEEQLGAAEIPPEVIDRLREHQGALPGAGGLRFRIAALPSRLPELLAALRDEDAETQSYPGLNLVYAGFRLPSEGGADAAERAFDHVGAAVANAAGSFACEAAPTWAKRGREMYGEVASLTPLFEALKTRFDPARVLNPGRFAGGL